MTNRKLNGFFIYVLLAVVLSACETGLKNGVVVDKCYNVGGIETYIEYDPVLEIPTTKTRWANDYYALILKGFNGKDTFKQRVEVSKTDYKNTNIGDTVTFQ